MAIPLLAMALGGAALGALANPKDRKKGALLGLGAGLLGPAAGAAMGAGAPSAAAMAPLAPGLAGPVATAPVGLMAQMNAAAGAQMSGLGSALTGETAKGLAVDTAPVALQLAMTPGQQQQAPVGRSLALQNQQGERISPYQRAALNRQQRMKGQGQQGPKRFV